MSVDALQLRTIWLEETALAVTLFGMLGAVVSGTVLTVSEKLLVAVNEPSLTVTVIIAVPVCPVAGVTLTVRLAPLPPNTMFALGTSVVLEELPLTVKLPDAVSASPTVNAIAAVAVFMVVLWLGMLEIVGASFTAFTVTKKLVLLLSCPSLTVTVIVAEPFWLVAGVTVTVRFAPLPPNTTFALGTSVVLEELPLTVKLPAAVSASPTVKLIGPATASSLIV